jgi:hypothetical protein
LNEVASKEIDMPYLEVRHGQVHQNSMPSKCGETIQTLLASPRNVSEECPLLNFREHHDSSESIVVDCAYGAGRVVSAGTSAQPNPCVYVVTSLMGNFARHSLPTLLEELVAGCRVFHVSEAESRDHSTISAV